MNCDHAVSQLSLTPEIVGALMEGVSIEQARWKPATDRWSLLEVLGHLRDEEREDFREALRVILERPADPWPLIDPFGWVEARAYNAGDRADTLEDFLAERRRSLEWLSTLRGIDWDSVHTGSGPGDLVMRAGDVLASWAAHDLWHIRQIVDLRREYLAVALAPYSGRYAGELP